MKTLTRILLACSISGLGLITGGCSMNRADSLRMLDRRADYEGQVGPELPPGLKEAGIDGFRNSPVPVRTRGTVAAVFAFPTDISSSVYFWGGWFSLVIDEPQWVLTRPGRLPPAPGITDVATFGSPQSKSGKAKKKTPILQ